MENGSLFIKGKRASGVIDEAYGIKYKNTNVGDELDKLNDSNFIFEKMTVLTAGTNNSSSGGVQNLMCSTFENDNIQPEQIGPNLYVTSGTIFQLNQYLYAIVDRSTVVSYGVALKIYSKLNGKYKIIGSSRSINTIMDVEADTLLGEFYTNKAESSSNSYDYPSIYCVDGQNGKALFIQYLGE